jgi:acyl-CoA synthetase (AMP-forming)/AMP-acid ligase II
MMFPTEIIDRPASWSIVESEPLPANIQSLLDDIAAGHPDKLLWRAIEGSGDVLSYTEFQRLSIVCAHNLRSIGVVRGSHVGLMMPNSSAFLVTWIALCRLGAVGVMINTASTTSELKRIIRETDVRHLVIDRQYLAAYEGLPQGSGLGKAHLVLHGPSDPAIPAPPAIDWSELVQGMPDQSLDFPPVTLDDIAGILFTSGSSGVPKGCMLSHRYWLTLGKARAVLGPAPDSVLVDTPMFYMGSLWKILMGIYNGATLNVAPRLTLSRLIDRLVDNKIEFCTVTAPAAKLAPDPKLKDSSLKWLTTYGLAKEMHEGIEKLFGVPVREIYGMTEVGSVLSMPVEDDSMVGSGSCGRPVPFRRCKLMLDGKEVPDGSPGELWVAGAGLFSGYYRNPDATEASFEGEWFKTGDLFRRDEHGYYYMLGRIKDVIRRGGENIAAAEVELAVTAIAGVLEVAAVPVPDPLRGEEVKVVIARAPTEAGAQLAPARIIIESRKTLSAFKVPRYVEITDDPLPKTASSKIDKVKLKAEAAVVAPHVYDALRTNSEESK